MQVFCEYLLRKFEGARYRCPDLAAGCRRCVIGGIRLLWPPPGLGAAGHRKSGMSIDGSLARLRAWRACSMSAPP